MFVAFVAFAACAPATAQQIAPNPNPSGSTISLGVPGGFNAINTFDNEGTVHVTSTGVLTNRDTCSFGCTLDTNQSGQLLNDGTLVNDGNLFVQDNGSLTNNGTWVNGDSSFGYTFLGNSATLLNSSGATITNTNNASLDIYDTSTFTNQGTLANYGSVFLLEDLGAPVFNNSGTFSNFTSGPGVTSLFSNDGTVNNSGVIENQAGSDIENTGVVNNLSGAQILNSGRMTNTRYPGTAAQINNAGDFIVTTTGVVDRSTVTQPYGTYAQTAGHTQIDGFFRTGQFNVSGGSVAGSGTLQSQAAVAIGDGAGAAAVFSAGGAGDATLAIVGTLNLASDAVTVVDISSAALFDLVTLTGSGIANLGGALQVQLLGGYTPSLGDTFTFIAANDINGSFASVLLPVFAGGTRTFELIFNSAANPTLATLRTIAVAPVPLPPAMGLLAPALALLMGMRRRAS
ncbi:MAG: hypothetical protein J0M16_02265 [Gammaproteobacteria bacterium]|nr:hypothetical protein [Gammaproteobacteria bacterium]